MRKKWLSTAAGTTLLASAFFGLGTAHAATNQDPTTYPVISEIEPNNQMSQAQSLSLGDEVTGTLAQNDTDMYKVTVDSLGILYVYGMTQNSTNPVNVQIYNANGVLINDGTSEDSSFYNEYKVGAGTYYIELSGNSSEVNGEEYDFYIDLGTPNVSRISGADRYDTSASIANEGWGDGTDEVVLATGQDFPDALAAGPLAYYLDAPVLLTRSDSLPDSVKSAIQQLGAKRVTIIGGTSAVSQQVEDYLHNTLGLQVNRIAGKDRFETAALIAKQLPVSTSAVVVNGRNYPDALSVAPYAAENQMPILLSEADSLPAATSGILSTITDTTVIGGASAISDSVFSKLPSPTRIGGKDRYETSLLVSQMMSGDSSFIATGTNFADALSGSALAAMYGEPIVLTPPTGLSDDEKNLFKERQTLSYTILGGTSALSEQVEQDIQDVINYTQAN